MGMYFRAVLAMGVVVTNAVAVAGGNEGLATDNVAKATTRALSFKRDIQPIFDANCVVCHQTGGAQAGLVLESGKSFSFIVGIKSQESNLLRINPGKPEESYLMHKLNGSHIEVGGAGEQMPTTQPLDTALIQRIRRWISEGASAS